MTNISTIALIAFVMAFGIFAAAESFSAENSTPPGLHGLNVIGVLPTCDPVSTPITPLDTCKQYVL